MSVIYLVKPREESGITAKARLVSAKKRTSAESYVLQQFYIERASHEECVSLGADGVVIESADISSR